MASITQKDIYNRSERLLGQDMMACMANARVIIFGVGGVGSWCAEGLVRSGITHLTIVDSDRVAVSNINRQLMATTRSVGMVKVDALKQRLLDINPYAEITALQKIYSEENYKEFDLDSYDYIIDAVDSLKDKASLILRACETNATFFSSMGAALKVDPTRIKVAEFWDVNGCPLGAALRKKLKRAKTYPAHKFLCVYDDEVLENKGGDFEEPSVSGEIMQTQGPQGDLSLASHEWNSSKAQINGSLAHITSIFGMTICGLVIKDLMQKSSSK
ncbi:MAG: tRNA threonylcarbamoyladenosine dehydratase [Bacteroidales bacterium]|nr:tRNA threonylcarbamoyladenosine dehydratase [Bacteroidales bacterium]